jgi:branched-chain amino acid transport system permease protein
LGLKAFVVSVIGGFGNLYGAVIAGLLLGLIEALVAGYISSNFRDAFAFVLLVAFLFVRPQGMFGEKQSERV